MPRPVSGESIGSYALRLKEQLDLNRPFWLLGQSFGGMLAIELARLCHPERLVLVSSIRCRKELPWYGRLIGNLRLHRLVPLSHPQYTSRISVFMNGIEAAEDLAVFKGFAEGRDIELLRWSVDQALTWRGSVAADNVTSIHGTTDRLLPIRYVKPDYRIEGGTHFMIVTQGPEISALMDRLLDDQRL
jgi:pimeloyl-ACP methyl ester carboxylesterase